MPFTIVKNPPESQVLSLKEAMHRWSQESQNLHIAYRTRGGAWGVLCYAKMHDDCERHYGFAYVSKLLTGRKLCNSDLHFQALAPSDSIRKVLEDNCDRSDLFLFQSWMEFVQEMAKRADNCE